MSARSYIRFAFADAATTRFLAFGFLMAFASSVGQTYFIGVFGPAIRAEFNLSHTSWSAIYMAGTLASAAVLPWTGQQIDRIPLRRFTVSVCLALAFAAAVMAWAPGPAALVVAIFLLRQTGQGLASHISSTAMARRFTANRGKAVSLASLGFSTGESLLPFLAVVAIGLFGWRATFGSAAFAVFLVVTPLVWWLLARAGQGGKSAREGLADGPDGAAQPSDSSWTRGEVLRDRRFLLMVPAVTAPSMIVTALFFHHLEIADAKGWGGAFLTGSYWVFAASSITSMLVAGPLIDRFSAVRIVPFYLLPMALGLAVVWGFDSRFWVWPYLALVGVTAGIGYTAITALWAELYGVAHLGAIKALVISAQVFTSALGPLIMGAMMDSGYFVSAISAVFAVYSLLTTVFLAAALRGVVAKG